MLTLLVLHFSASVSAQSNIIDQDKLNEAVALNNAAGINYADANYDSAIIKYRKAIEINKLNSTYPFGLAISFYELQKYDSAKKYILNAIELEPNVADFHYRAGNIYFHMKEYEAANTNYTIALRTFMDSDVKINLHNCYFNRGLSTYYLKDYSSAIKDLSWVIEDNPSNATAVNIRGLAYFKSGNNTKACEDLAAALDMGHKTSSYYLEKYCR